MLTDGRRTDAGVTGILLAHPLAFGSGELIIMGIIMLIFATSKEDTNYNQFCIQQCYNMYNDKKRSSFFHMYYLYT